LGGWGSLARIEISLNLSVMDDEYGSCPVGAKRGRQTLNGGTVRNL
jgi:hypothetical protein